MSRKETTIVSNVEARRKREIAAAFTLTELLVVIAITIILLGLLFGPIVQAFNINRRTQSQAEAQDAARFGLERMARELKQASYVFDNSRTPIILPLEDPTGALPRANQYGIKYPDLGSGPDSTPPYIFSKLDFVGAGTLPNGPADVTDPTTDKTVGGKPLRFPLAPGTRVVRYFIGLRRPFRANGNTITPLFYSNVYQFPRTDSGEYNPFVLWRAEFDPSNPNLVKQNSYGSIVEDEGGFNDPDFFYNVALTGPNGRTFAENWREVSSPIVSSGNLDMLIWQFENGRRDVDEANPFRPAVAFTPGAVAGDTATPGFLTDPGNAAPVAVPTLYTTKHGQWTLPFTVDVYRFANKPGDAAAGRLQIQVRGNDTTGSIDAVVLTEAGSLVTGQVDVPVDVFTGNNASADFTARMSRRTGRLDGRLFVKTRNLSFFVDPVQGRIETGLSALAGDTAGNPQFNNFNEPVATTFRLNTRDLQAGLSLPANAGILRAYLNNSMYFSPLQPNTALPSPFAIFGGVPPGQNPVATIPFGGIAIAPGSTRLLGPDNDPANTSLVSYNEIPVVGGFPAGGNIIPAGTPPGALLPFAAGPLVYQLENGDPLSPFLRFDYPDLNTASSRPYGLPASNTSGQPYPQGGQPFQREIQVSYLWQNNFARTAAGQPIDEDGNTGVNSKPVADQIKVSYSTRSLMNIAMTVQVYNTSGGRPTQMRVSDQVEVNNFGR